MSDFCGKIFRKTEEKCRLKIIQESHGYITDAVEALEELGKYFKEAKKYEKKNNVKKVKETMSKISDSFSDFGEVFSSNQFVLHSFLDSINSKADADYYASICYTGKALRQSGTIVLRDSEFFNIENNICEAKVVGPKINVKRSKKRLKVFPITPIEE